MEEGTEMLTFEQWCQLRNQLEAELAELDARCNYRRLQVLGPMYVPRLERFGRGWRSPDVDEFKLDTDEEYTDLVFLRDRVRERLEFVKQTGKYPPDMDREE